MLSVVIPTLNARGLAAGDAGLGGGGGRGGGGRRRQQRRNRGRWRRRWVRAWCRRRRGRGAQLAAGVAAARGDVAAAAARRYAAGAGLADDAARTWRPTGAGYFRFALDSDDPRARRLERLVAWRCRVLGAALRRPGPADPSRPAARGRRHPAAAADGGRRSGPPPRPPAAGRRWTSPRSPRRRSGSARAGIAARCATWLCLTLYFAGVPPRLIARLYG